MSPPPPVSPADRQGLVFLLLMAVALTMWFWLDLWLNGGLIGGDVYSYYFPQKAFLSDALAAGERPYWNPLVGNGYPVVGESQTGLFYPPTAVLYRLFDLNTAYNWNHLLHYVAAFLATGCLARGVGLSVPGALLAALVFVYGWFPPRCCHEWAILTGTYLPLNLWLLIRYLQTANPGWLWGLAGGLGVQLLAGHYHLAFITLLALGGLLVYFWFWSAVSRGAQHAGQKGSQQVSQQIPQGSGASPPPAIQPATDSFVGQSRLRRLTVRQQMLPIAAIGLGFLLAAVQLGPTWSLKQSSQRQQPDGAEFSPAYGHIPPRYFSQLWLPWSWYTLGGELPTALNATETLAISAPTDPVEAHLYLGLLPLMLVVFGLWACRHDRTESRWWLLGLGLIGLSGALLATGWLMPLLGEWPGFRYFRGLGRYGILTALAGALWAGYGWTQLQPILEKRLPVACGWGLWSLLLIVTVCDFSWVSQQITYTFMVPESPVPQREQSPIRQLLHGQLPPARLFAPGPNLPTLTGIAATPVYLGLGPAEYFDPALMYPPGPDEQQSAPFGTQFTTAQLTWLRRQGVTHLLGFGPPPDADGNWELIWSGIDPLLNPAWGRPEPLFLSALRDAPGRGYWLPEWQPEQTETPESAAATSPVTTPVTSPMTWNSYRADSIRLTVEAATPGLLVLTDIFDPDWQVRVNDLPANQVRIDGMLRGVALPAGVHDVVWSYQPAALRLGYRLSIAAFTIWLVWGGVWIRGRYFVANRSAS